MSNYIVSPPISTGQVKDYDCGRIYGGKKKIVPICRIPLFTANCRGLTLHLKIYGNAYCILKIRSVGLLVFTFCCVEQMH